MPYDTPYNRYIAKLENHSNQAYADYNAYSNQMYNTPNKPFSEVYKELKLPERPFLESAKRISNHDGGITGVNGEGWCGAGSYTAKQMRHSRMGEDTRRPLFTAESESEAEESGSDQEGGGVCSESDEETENVIIGRAEPMKCMPVKELVKEHKGLVKVLEDKSGKHSALMKKEAAKQKKELKAYEKKMKGGADKERVSKRKAISPSPSPSSSSASSSSSSSATEGSDAEMNEISKGMKKTKITTEKKKKGPKQSKVSDDKEKGRKAPTPSPPPPPDIKGKGVRKPSKWIEFVKSWSAENKMSYRDALRSPKLKADYAKHKTGGFAFLPLLASAVAPLAIKGATALVNKIRGKGENKSGGSVIGGPANDPVNKGKITLDLSTKKRGKKMKGGKILPSEEFYPSTGNYYEGASLGAGMKKGRGKGKKTGASLFLTPSVQPTMVKSSPASQDQIEKAASIVEVKGNGKRKRRTKKEMAEAKEAKAEAMEGGMLKTLLPGSSFSGGAKKASGWIAHVKAYAAKHKVKYGEALKLAAASYKK